jgi:hypothetical protein
MRGHIFYLMLITLLCIPKSQAQNSNKSFSTAKKAVKLDGDPLSINPDNWYLDAGFGYFPATNASSLAGQIGAGYRLSLTSAVGIAGANWGRISLYQRSAIGIGLQYRHILGDNFIAKAECGYVLKAYLNNDVLNRTFEYVSKSSTPLYYKVDLHWRAQHFLTLGISAYQSSPLKFRTYFPDASVSPILNSWRINAITIQLGVALDTRNSE